MKIVPKMMQTTEMSWITAHFVDYVNWVNAIVTYERSLVARDDANPKT